MSGSVKRPCLRYFGGKWKLAPWIISHFPPHRCYVELFGGGASVLLRKQPSHVEIYNDMWGDVVTFFRVLRDEPDALIRLIALTPYSRAEFENCRTGLPSGDVDAARRLYTVAWNSWGTGAGLVKNSGWRRSRSHNVARQSADMDNLLRSAERLRSVQIEQGSALSLIPSTDADDTLFYADPPYVTSTRCVRTRSDDYECSMSDSEHVTLLERLGAIKGHAIVSGYDCDIYRECLNGWNRVTRPSRKANNTTGEECLWIHPRTAAAIPETVQGSIFAEAPR